MQAIEREQEWKDIHKRALLNESFVEVSLEITDPDALADATSQDNGAIYTSPSKHVAELAEKITHPYCTLEQNLWCLDGSRQVIPEFDFEDETYTSDVLSDETCVFSTKRPTITIGFGAIHDKPIPGLTITWSETYKEYADTFEVIVYKANNIVFTKEVMGNKSIKTIVFLEFVNYDRVEVIVKKWCLPNRRARVEGILMGLHKAYGKGDLFNYSHKQFIDPISASLPKSEITFSINNVDGEYDLTNPQGIAKYLTERQEVKVRYGLKMDDGSIEWAKGGVFYLAEWYAKQNGITADFTARDLFGFMSDIVTDADIINGLPPESPTTVRGLAMVMLKRVPLLSGVDSERRWMMDESVMFKDVRNPIPTDTIANNLQLLANMAKCVLYQDRDGVIHFEPLGTRDTDYEITSSNSYSKPEISLAKPVRQVIAKAYEVGVGSAPYWEPIYTPHETSYPISVPAGNSGDIITVDNYMVPIEQVSNGDGTWGIGTSEAQGLAEWVYSYLSQRTNFELSWRPDVRLDALDVVTVHTDYKTTKVRLSEIEYKYNGAFRATGKGRVIEDG